MANEWGKIQLSCIAKLRSGFPFKSSSWVDDGVPVIKITNVKDGRIVADGCGYVSHETAATMREWMTQKGDVLIAMTGYVGEIALIRSGEKYLINQRVGRFDFLDDSPVIPEFFFYYLRQSEVRSLLEKMARGSAQPNLSASDVAKLCVPVPPIAEQRAIAHILGTLDDKIELNRKQNETLEAMARALFKAWFVDFEPVRAKMEGRWQRGQSLPGLPAHLYDLFPDRLVDSELGPIPEGWKEGKLCDLVNLVNDRVKPTSANDSLHYIALDDIPTKSLSLAQFHLGSDVNSSIITFKKGDILFGAMRPYFHRVGLAPFDGITRTTTFVLRPFKPQYRHFALFHFFSDPVIEFSKLASVGTTIPYVKWDTLGMYELPIPQEKVLVQFEQITKPIIDMIETNNEQTRTIAQIRDTLLPKLLSGEIRVKDAEKFLEANL
jgi:type I restriction enzyme S subunit